MIKICANTEQIHSIFGKCSLKKIKPVSSDENLYHIDYNGTLYEVIIREPNNFEVDWNGDITDSLDYFSELSDNFLFNPENDYILVLDRWEYQNVFVNPVKIYGLTHIKNIEKLYSKRNIKVVLGNAYFEPMAYEKDDYVCCSYPYDFDFIRFTDYPLFKDCKNTKYNPFYSIFNYTTDIFGFNKLNTSGDVFLNWFDSFNFKPSSDTKLFSMMGGKPRYHRLYFINKCIEYNIDSNGYITMNKFFLDEYRRFIKNINYRTDPTYTQNKQLEKYWNLDFYKEPFYYKNIKDPLGEHKRFDYVQNNVEEKEYNNGYIEISIDTHIIFNKIYDFFSEKAYHGIFFNKIFVSIGCNKFYREFEKIGGYNFIKELGINPLFLQEDDPIKQVDYLINALSNLTIDDISSMYIENIDKINHNKKLILNYYIDNMEFVRNYILNI